MASLRLHPTVPLGTFNKIETIQRKLTWPAHKNGTLRFDNTQRKAIGVCASLSLSNPQSCDTLFKNDDQRKEVILSENIDEWMKESMVDIVKNLKQAPLLVQIYAQECDRGQERRPQIKTERAMLEKWPKLKSEWENGEKSTPDGLIFVEELKDEEERDLINENENVNLDEDFEEGLTKSWGVVVQGKGVEYGPACYLLKTSRVRAGRGMGLFATHFCLVRVKNFRESALRQFNGCWLV